MYHVAPGKFTNNELGSFGFKVPKVGSATLQDHRLKLLRGRTAEFGPAQFGSSPILGVVSVMEIAWSKLAAKSNEARKGVLLFQISVGSSILFPRACVRPTALHFPYPQYGGPPVLASF